MSSADGAFLTALRSEPLPAGFSAPEFDCGERDLTDYLNDGTAASEELAAFSRCYVVLTDADNFVGYFNVLADSIRLAGSERPKGLNYTTAPAIKLGRMGVDGACKGRGVGHWILDYVVGLARDLSGVVGVRYVTLDALNKDRLVAWYEGYGFVRNRGEEGRRDAVYKFYRKIVRGEPESLSMRYDVLLKGEVVTSRSPGERRSAQPR